MATFEGRVISMIATDYLGVRSNVIYYLRGRWFLALHHEL